MIQGRIYGEGVGVRKGPPTPSPKITCAFLIQLEFYKKKSLCFLLVLKSNMGDLEEFMLNSVKMLVS